MRYTTILAIAVSTVLTGCVSGDDEQALNQALDEINQAAAANEDTGYDNPVILVTPDNTSINLTLSPLGYITAKTSKGILTGHNQNYSFYGMWRVNNSNRITLHVNGNKTDIDDIPLSGTAIYSGQAERGDTVNNASTTIKVDFARKAISGEILFPANNQYNVTLYRGRITGNGFNGTAGVAGNNTGTYNGYFFGPNAQEIGGLVQFNNNPALTTAFGGRRNP